MNDSDSVMKDGRDTLLPPYPWARAELSLNGKFLVNQVSALMRKLQESLSYFRVFAGVQDHCLAGLHPGFVGPPRKNK